MGKGTAKLDDLSLIPGPTKWKEETVVSWVMISFTSPLPPCCASLVWGMSTRVLSAGSDCSAPFLRTEVPGEVSKFIRLNHQCTGWEGAKEEVIWGDLRVSLLDTVCLLTV